MEKKKKKKRKKENLGLTRQQKNDPLLIAEALVACKGLVANAAELLGTTSGTLSKKIKEVPQLKEILKHIALKKINNAETALDDLIEARDFKAIKFFLETKGKDEGFGKETVINHNVQKFGVLMIEAPAASPEDWSKQAIEERSGQNLEDKTVTLLKKMDGSYE